MPHARNESPVTGRIADFRLQRLIAVRGFRVESKKKRVKEGQNTKEKYFRFLFVNQVMNCE